MSEDQKHINNIRRIAAYGRIWLKNDLATRLEAAADHMAVLSGIAWPPEDESVEIRVAVVVAECKTGAKAVSLEAQGSLSDSSVMSIALARFKEDRIIAQAIITARIPRLKILTVTARVEEVGS